MCLFGGEHAEWFGDSIHGEERAEVRLERRFRRYGGRKTGAPAHQIEEVVAHLLRASAKASSKSPRYMPRLRLLMAMISASLQ
jgi:hypothetical protein